MYFEMRCLTSESLKRAKGCLYSVLFRACDSMGLHLSFAVPIAVGAGCLFAHDLKPLCLSFPWILKGWLASEFCWVVWTKVTLKRLQRMTSPPSMTRAERKLLWERCLKWAPDKHSFVRSWMYNVSFDQIHLDDCKSWVAWGLWGKRLKDLSSQVKTKFVGCTV